MKVGLKRLLQYRSPVRLLVPLLLAAGLHLLLGMAALPARAEPARQEAELLENPGFEDGFYAWNGNSTLQLGSGWTPWWIDNPEHDPSYTRPEFRPVTAADPANRIHSGENAQQWFTLHSSFYAGLYQRVSEVTPERPYRFSAWTQVWSSVEDGPSDVSTSPANPHLQIGIDPYGNVDPFSADIIWSYEAGMHEVIDGWSQLSVEAVARNSSITVFVRSRPEFPNKHNYVFLDDASLQPVLPPTPTATPTTPAPTATATATATATSTTAPTLNATITFNGTPTATASIEQATGVAPTAVTGTVEVAPTEISPTGTAPPSADDATRPPPTATQVQPTEPATVPPAPSDTPGVAHTVAPPVGQTPVTPTPVSSISETPAGPAPDVQTATAGATPAPPTASATTTLASAETETQPAATTDTQVAMISPTAPPNTAPPPAAEQDAGQVSDRGLLCVVPILVIGLFGLALVVLRRRLI